MGARKQEARAKPCPTIVVVVVVSLSANGPKRKDGEEGGAAFLCPLFLGNERGGGVVMLADDYLMCLNSSSDICELNKQTKRGGDAELSGGLVAWLVKRLWLN